MALIVPIINRERRIAARIMREHFRDISDPFQISEDLFIAHYRLPQVIAMRLINEIRPFAEDLGDVPLELQILSVLNFYASGCYQLRVGASAFNSLSQPMISRYITKYSDIIVEQLAPKYVRFPQTRENMEITKRNFMLNFNFPGILGVIDGTHVALSALPKNIEHAYINRKGFHSINAQIVCNAELMITNMNARYSGSTHDSFIFNNSELFIFLERLYLANPNEMNFLIGDSAYGLSPWLMKIIDNENLNIDQQRFNRDLSKTRQIVERCIGILKMRFRCILGERKLRYLPRKASIIIYSCATLHNFLIVNKFHMMRDIDDDMLRRVINLERNNNVIQLRQQANNRLGEQRRNNLINALRP